MKSSNLLVMTGSVFFLAACGGSSSGGGGSGGDDRGSDDNVTVTAVAGEGGSISPGGMRVTRGETISFTLRSDAGFALDFVTGCNGQMSEDTYVVTTFGDCTVNASFTPQNGDVIFGRYLPIEDGSIIRDTETGLEWQRCSVGQQWNSNIQRCTGSPSGFSWDDAVTLTAPGGFRTPTIWELQTLIYCSNTGKFYTETFSGCHSSPGEFERPTIVRHAFPDVPETGTGTYWSSSSYPFEINNAESVTFMSGYRGPARRNMDSLVRLVRVGQ